MDRKNFLILAASLVLASACGGGSTAESTSSPSAETEATANSSQGNNEAGPTDEGIDANPTGGTVADDPQVGEGIPEDLPFPLPEGGSVYRVLEEADNAVLTMEYEGNRQEEIVQFYDAWIEGDSSIVLKQKTDTGTGIVLFTLEANNSGSYVISVSLDPTSSVTGIQMGWPRSG